MYDVLNIKVIHCTDRGEICSFYDPKVNKVWRFNPGTLHNEFNIVYSNDGTGIYVFFSMYSEILFLKIANRSRVVSMQGAADE